MSSFQILSALVKNPKDTHFDGQEEGEQIVFLLRRHWVTNVYWLIGSGVALFIPSLFFAYPDLFGFGEVPLRIQFGINLAWCLFTLGFAFQKFLSWYFNAYLVTNKRVLDIDFFGLFYTRVSEASLSKVQDVTYRMGGIAQVLFNYGNIYIQTAAEQREFDFDAVPSPSYVHDKLTDLVEAAGGKSDKS